MRHPARLLEIIQILRSANAPVTAMQIAGTLEVSPRTVYRDIAALQAMRTPIEGEAGIGYVMRSGYDLPPLNFNADEIEALVVGLSLLARTGDRGLQQAAARISAKIDTLRRDPGSLQSSPWGASAPPVVDPATLRHAIRDERCLQLTYSDEAGRITRRTVKLLVLIYYIEDVVLAAWCELRHGFRHFRLDRVTACKVLDRRFNGEGAELRRDWEAERV
jgi:predicted DNA-binding transcriptional regulator YafY